MRRLSALLPLALCFACASEASKPAQEKGADGSTKSASEEKAGPVVDESSKDPRRNPLAEPDFGDPGPLKLEPRMPDLESKPGSRPHVLGWSKSGEEFGYCVGAGGDSCTRCEFYDRAGNIQIPTDCVGESKTPDPAKTKELEEQIAAAGYGVPNADWRFGEVTVVWDAVPGKPAEGIGARLRVGGQADSRVPVYFINLGEEGYRTIWPELIALSPEGDRIGIISHAYEEAGQLESYKIQISDADELASMAFNGAGMLMSHNKQYERAIDHFHKAAFAWSDQKWSMYNLACSLAQTGAPGVEAALVAAIERGGAEVKAKLGTDGDLDPVRGEPWFAELAR